LGAYADTHRYSIEKLGTGSPVTLKFQINDFAAYNDTGGLCVSIFKFNNSAPIADPNGPYLGAYMAIPFDGQALQMQIATPNLCMDFGDGGRRGSQPTHSYTSAGIYDVSLTVNDGYVDSAVVKTFAVVVYDPSAGFVTGGGWIDSPAGAYTADPTLTGKATFGFVAKYQKGANVPSGNTEFQFKVGNLNFKSTSYEWLVVAGTQAIFKGVGTIERTRIVHVHDNC
jgi:hypothetical protein